ncbi:MAG: PASTA domain-containing protein [Bdellovibrionota bacterium]
MSHKKRILMCLAALFGSFSITFLVTLQLLVHEKSQVTVPNLVGQSFEQAQQHMQELGLELVIEEQRFEPDQYPGTILRQSIDPGQEIPKGRKIFITQSKEPLIDSMPDLIDQDLTAVKAMLSKLEIRSVELSYACSNRIRQGSVLVQKPSFGLASSGQTIHLLVSEGPCETPYLLADPVLFSDDQILSDLRAFQKHPNEESLRKIRSMKKGTLVSPSSFGVKE